FEDATLTWPTVYAAYATFSHISVEPVGSECVSETLSLTLPSPTSYTSLIVVESDIPNPAFVAPTVVSYLNTLPTVLAQLGRPIGEGACDPIVGSTATPDTSTLAPTTYVESRSALETTVTRRIPQAINAPPRPTEVISDAPPTTSAAQPSSSSPPPPPPSSSNPPLPLPSSSEIPAPSSQTPVPTSIASPSSSLADSASEVPEASSAPPSIIPSRSLPGSTTTSNGTASASRPSSSFSVFTGAAALPTGHIAGFLIGAAGLGLGLF
ncbi:hypothetical protein BKA66DRAFT_193048, partial [Pyrenochaeta sp. MPI-SDFR-AT-0127]